MTIHLTRLEDTLAASPTPTLQDIATRLDDARASLERALRMPLAPAQHARAQTQMRAVLAAGAILESLARSYGRS